MPYRAPSKALKDSVTDLVKASIAESIRILREIPLAKDRDQALDEYKKTKTGELNSMAGSYRKYARRAYVAGYPTAAAEYIKLALMIQNHIAPRSPQACQDHGALGVIYAMLSTAETEKEEADDPSFKLSVMHFGIMSRTLDETLGVADPIAAAIVGRTSFASMLGQHMIYYTTKEGDKPINHPLTYLLDLTLQEYERLEQEAQQ
jgi:hypothetical protein